MLVMFRTRASFQWELFQNYIVTRASRPCLEPPDTSLRSNWIGRSTVTTGIARETPVIRSGSYL
jgi:hypothetical protein